MIDEIQSLIGYQRAEFGIATKYSCLKFLAQCAIIVIGVFAIDASRAASFWLAFFSLVLALTWVALDVKYRSVRSNSERARRATLIMGGLGRSISSAELNDIRESLTASEDEAKAQQDPNYFATKSPAGPKRLSEMLEESTYWTLNLQRTSGQAMWGLVAFIFLIAVGSLFWLTTTDAMAERMAIAQVLCVILSFVVGTELLGNALSYNNTVRVLDRLMHRFDSAKARGHQDADLMMMLSDYNAAVETTPLTLPFIYWLKKDRLVRNWSNRSAGVPVAK